MLLEFESVDGTDITVKLLAPDETEMWSVERVPKGQYGFTTPQVGAPSPNPSSAFYKRLQGHPPQHPLDVAAAHGHGTAAAAQLSFQLLQPPHVGLHSQ